MGRKIRKVEEIIIFMALDVWHPVTTLSREKLRVPGIIMTLFYLTK